MIKKELRKNRIQLVQNKILLAQNTDRIDDLRKMHATLEQERIQHHKYRIELERENLESRSGDSRPNEQLRKKRDEDSEKLMNNEQID